MPHASHYPPYLLTVRLAPSPSSSALDVLQGVASVQLIDEQPEASTVRLLPCESAADAHVAASDLLPLLPLAGAAGTAADLTVAFVAGGPEHPMASFSVPPSLVQILMDRRVGLTLRRVSRIEDVADLASELATPPGSKAGSDATLLLAVRLRADECHIDRGRVAALGGEPRRRPPVPGVVTITTANCTTVAELEKQAALILDEWLAGPPLAPGVQFEAEVHVGVVIPGDDLDGTIYLPAHFWARLAANRMSLRVSFYLSAAVETRTPRARGS